MRAAIHPHQGFWLDRQDGLLSVQQAALSQAGLHAQVVSDWSEVPSQGQGVWLAIRLDNAQDLAELTQWQQASGASIAAIARVPRHDMALAVAAMKAGVHHVLAQDEISVMAWREALRHDHTAAPAPAAPAQPKRSAVYVDPQSRHLLALAQRVGQAGVTALIEGPTGAGKEVLARVLHESSPRARGPFVALNCATLPEQLIDDMLFGHEKGAFTGAQGTHRGLFEQAQGGSIFLDEIGEMPLHLQAKLLRVLQERQLTRLGSERRIDLDVRVIAATNKDLRQAIALREFREDLYFRISTFKLRIAPLAERPGDILPLAACLLQRLAPAGQAAFSMHPQAQAMLLGYAWPGNVRELENVMQRAVVLCADQQIRPEHLMFDAPLAMPAPQAQPAQEAPKAPSALPDWSASLQAPVPAPIALQPEPLGERLHDAVRHNEHQLILAAIEATNSRIEAARKLGISPRTLRYKLAKLKAQPLALDPMHAMSGS